MRTSNSMIAGVVVALMLMVSTLFATYIQHTGTGFGSPGFSGDTYLVNSGGSAVNVDVYIHMRTSGMGDGYSYYFDTFQVPASGQLDIGNWSFGWCSDVDTELCYEYMSDSP